LVLFALGPIDLDDAVAVDHQLFDVLTAFVMDYDTLAERDIADDVLAPKRIAAAGPRREQIVDALDDYRVFAEADEFLDGLDAGGQTIVFTLFGVKLGKFLGPEELGQHVSRQRLAVADRGEQIFGPA